MADYTDLVSALRERAGCFDYDGRPDIACDYEQAADAIEELANARNELSAMCLKLTRTIDEMEKENMRHERRDGF